MYKKFTSWILTITFIILFCSPAPHLLAEKDKDGELYVALIIPTSKRDRAWSQSMYEALYNLKEGPGDLPLLYLSVHEKISNLNKFESVIEKAVEDGSKFIIAHSPTYKWKMFDLATQYPETYFAVATDRQDIDTRTVPTNVFVYSAAESEAGYLNGVIAALSVDFATVGMVVPEAAASSVVNNYVEGFRNGLLATSPASSTRISYVQSPWNIDNSTEAASLLILNDAEILTGIFPQAIGALHVAKTNDIPWVGIEYNQRSVGPNNVLASQMYSWEPVIREMILHPHQKKPLYTINYANGGIKTIYNRAAMNDIEEVRDIVDKITAGIINGYIDPLNDDLAIR